MAEVIIMPKLGFDMAEGTLINWVKQEGEAIEKGELLAEIETDKATVEVESLYAGTVLKHLASAGAIVPVNTPIAVIGDPGEEIDLDALTGGVAAAEPVPAEADEEKEEPAAAPVPATTPTDTNLPDGVRASPLARNMAEEHGINLSQLSGSGPGGRIVKKDIEAALAQPKPVAPPAAQPAPATQAAPAAPSLPALAGTDYGPPPVDERVPLSRLRQAIGRRMVQAKQDLPHFYITNEIDMAPVMALRKQANGMLEGSGEKLSVNDFIVKAAALALRRFPNINASLGDGEVIRHGSVNVGVAVAVENGLLTVVCHDTDRKTLRQISQEVRSKAGRAREGKVQSADIEGSTFSISNLGMFDVDSFAAIINPPEAAILAVGSAQQVPVVVDGELAVGWRMKATISADHRVTDGAEAAQFMQALKEYLENPVSLML